MKIDNKSGNFCNIFVEQTDAIESVIQTISQQTKPIVIFLVDQSSAFRRPQDFVDLKILKRYIKQTIIFIIPRSYSLEKMATQNGFPVYPSIEKLVIAFEKQQVQTKKLTPKLDRKLNRKFDPKLDRNNREIQQTVKRPLKPVHLVSPQKTLTPDTTPIHYRQTTPLVQITQNDVQETTPLKVILENKQVQLKRNQFGPLFLIVLIICITIGSFAGVLILYSPNQSTNITPSVLGQITFLNSGQLHQNDAQGINDEIQISLNHVTNPAPSKVYYGWLLPDQQQDDVVAIPLSVLHVHNGTIDQLFQGTAQHTNLLKTTSRFLITEEDAIIPPIAPSPDQLTWKYYGEISQTVQTNTGSNPQYRYIDHLRHLLADDPTLDQLNLQGGLNSWFYQNSAKLTEWANSLRGSWEDPGLIIQQTTRILTYLDGNTYVSKDLPANLSTNTSILTNASQFGLINIAGMTQQTPSYIDHITKHLNGLLQSPGSSNKTQIIVASLLKALSNGQYWLAKARSTSVALVKLINSQQGDPLSLINDLITNVTNAFVGVSDMGTPRNGIIYIHNVLQQLATISVLPYQN